MEYIRNREILKEKEVEELSSRERPIYLDMVNYGSICMHHDQKMLKFSKLEELNEIFKKFATNRTKTFLGQKQYEKLQYEQFWNDYLMNVLNAMMIERNNIISSLHPYDHQVLVDIQTGLRDLNEYIEKNILSLDKFLVDNAIQDQIKEMQTIFDKDIKHYQSYAEEYTKKKFNYEYKKSLYENKSRFGKLIAKINGQEKALRKAHLDVTSYNEMNGTTHNIQNPANNESVAIKVHNRLDEVAGKKVANDVFLAYQINTDHYQDYVNDSEQKGRTR